MAKRGHKLSHAAHVKRATQGTSNELSFSVLDAARESLDGGTEKRSGRRARPRGAMSGRGGEGPLAKLGHIPLFTLGGARKPPSTPTKERGITLPSGEFVSTESPSAARGGALPPVTSRGTSSRSAGRAPSSVLGGGAHRSAADCGSSWQVPAGEVARRKSQRRRHRLAVAAAVAAGAVVAVGFLGTLGYSFIQAQSALRGDLAVALGAIQRADEGILPMDSQVTTRINEGVESGDPAQAREEWDALSPQVDQSLEQLQEARAAVEAVQSSLVDARDKEAANRALAAINARENMIEAGRSIMATALPALSAQRATEDAWAHLLEADSLSRDAAAALSTMTRDTVSDSMAKSEQALAGFIAARDALTQAAQDYPAVDFSPYLAYLDLRVDSQYAAIASDQAYLARDKATMSEQNARYNELDAQAAAAAQAFEANPTELVGPSCDRATADMEAAYSSERLQAADADAFLRDYLSSLGN